MELDNNFGIGYYALATDYAARGLYAEALPLAEKAYSLLPRTTYVIGLLAGIRSQLGIPHDDLLAHLQLQLESKELGPAIYYLIRGEMDVAVDWMEKETTRGNSMTPIFLANPLGRKFRQSPRWPTLARLMNFPDESDVTA